MTNNGNYDISGSSIFVCGGVINGKSLGWTANLNSSPYSYPISASWNSSTGKLTVYGSLGYASTGAFDYRYIAVDKILFYHQTSNLVHNAVFLDIQL